MTLDVHLLGDPADPSPRVEPAVEHAKLWRLLRELDQPQDGDEECRATTTQAGERISFEALTGERHRHRIVAVAKVSDNPSGRKKSRSTRASGGRPLPRCEWMADGPRCGRNAIPGKRVCEHHEWVMAEDPAWIDFLGHLGRLLAREYVAEQTGLTREAVRRLSR